MKVRVATLITIAAAVSIVASGVLGPLERPLPDGLGPDAAAAAYIPGRTFGDHGDGGAWSHVEARQRDDFAAMTTFRPGYTFRQQIFTIADGHVVFGRASTGSPLAVFPASGDWTRDGTWKDPALARTLKGRVLPRSLDARRDYVAQLLEAATGGPVLYHTTRGGFLAPGVQRYGSFLAEWGAIYERFGVPAEIGLAQALVESGFVGTRRSEAGAVGLCQWLEGNWKRLDRLAPAVLEARNQTTQAAYCAAYLSVLATKYGSFIPALSDHHAGGTNVGRILISGERLDGRDAREQYFLGAALARDLRTIAHGEYSGIYRSYGFRSFLYAEMVFGNTPTVRNSIASTPQSRIHAMRTTRSVPLAEIARHTGLAVDEIRRFNPALDRLVPAGATLYLPTYEAAFGRDVSFWHGPPADAYASVLEEFVRLDVSPHAWDEPVFQSVLRDFAGRFRATQTEEGAVMATVLAYVLDESSSRVRRGILAEFKASPEIRRLFDRAVRERQAVARPRG